MIRPQTNNSCGSSEWQLMSEKSMVLGGEDPAGLPRPSGLILPPLSLTLTPFSSTPYEGVG